jgi:hypothetical protein
MTPTEQWLAAAWAQVLRIPRDQIGPRDHFFDRGGTSLSAVKLAVALDRAVSLKDLTSHPVLADLAGLVDRTSSSRTPERNRDALSIPGVAARCGPATRQASDPAR